MGRAGPCRGFGAGPGAGPGVTVFEGVLSGVGAWQLSAARLRAKGLGSDPPGTGSHGKTLSRRVTGGTCIYVRSLRWKLEGLMLLSQCLGEGSAPWIFPTSGSLCMLFHLPEVFFPAPVHLATFSYLWGLNLCVSVL